MKVSFIEEKTVCVGLNIYKENQRMSQLGKLRNRGMMDWTEIKVDLRRYG
jgi:hypothetical protein